MEIVVNQMDFNTKFEFIKGLKNKTNVSGIYFIFKQYENASNTTLGVLQTSNIHDLYR